jgi:hypothetical protein
VDRDTHRRFFHDIFCTCGQHAAKDIITMPDDENSVRHVMALYERQGLPGCVGSVDLCSCLLGPVPCIDAFYL